MEMERLYELYKQHPVVTTDSRECPQGALFFALKGENFNGNAFAAQALARGCAYAVVDEQQYVEQGDARFVLVDDALAALQQLAHHHREQFRIPVIQVTGTNGKTTAVMLIDRILRAARIPSHAVGNTGAAFSAVVVLLNILYVLFQDLYIFPRTFSNYAEYKKSTPFLIPSRGSILRCRDSWRGAGRG